MQGTSNIRNVFDREPKLTDDVIIMIGLVLIYLPLCDGQIFGVSPSRSFSSNMRNSQAHSVPTHGLPMQGRTADRSIGNDGGINLADSFFLNRIRQGDTDAIMRLGELRQTVDTPMSLLHNFFQTLSRPHPRQRTGLFSLLHNLAVARGFLPNTLAIGSNTVSANQQTETPLQNRNAGIATSDHTRNAGGTSGGNNRNAVNDVNVNSRPIETTSNIPLRNILGRVSNGQINTFQNRAITQTSLEVADSREIIIPRRIHSGRSQRQSSFGRRVGHHRNDVFRAANQDGIISPNSASGRNMNVENVNIDFNRERALVPMQGLQNQGLPHNNVVNTISTAINNHDGNFRVPNNVRERNINTSSMTFELNNSRFIVPRQSGFPQESRVQNSAQIDEIRSENIPNASIPIDSNSGNGHITESLPLQHQGLSIVDRVWGTGFRNGNFRNAELNGGNGNITALNDTQSKRQTLTTLGTEIRTGSNRLANAELNVANFGSVSMNVNEAVVVGNNSSLDPKVSSNTFGSRIVDVQRNLDGGTPRINREMFNNNNKNIETRNRTSGRALQTQRTNNDVIDNNVAIPSNISIFWTERMNGGRFSAPQLGSRRGVIRERQVITKILTFPPLEGTVRSNETPPKSAPPEIVINRTRNITDTNRDIMSIRGANIIRSRKIPSVLGFILNLPRGVPLSSGFSQNESTNHNILTTTPANMHSATDITTTPSFEHMTLIHSIDNLPFSEATSLQEIIELFSNTSQPYTSPTQASTVIDSIDFRKTEPHVHIQNASTTNFNGNAFPETTTANTQSTQDFILQKVGHIELEPKDHVLQLVGDMNLTLAEPEYNIQLVGDLNLGRRRQFVMEVSINGSAQSDKVLMQRVGNNDRVSGERIRVHGSGDVRLVTKERVVIERLGYITFQTDPLRNPQDLTNNSKPKDEVRSVFRIEPLSQTQNSTGLLFLGNETTVKADKKHNETVLQFVGDVLADIPEAKLNASRTSTTDVNNKSAAINSENNNGDNITANAETLVKTPNNITTENFKLNLNKTFTSEVLLNSSISSGFLTPVLSEIQAPSAKQEVTPWNDTKSLQNIELVLNPIGRIFTTVGMKSDTAKGDIKDRKEVG